MKYETYGEFVSAALALIATVLIYEFATYEMDSTVENPYLIPVIISTVLLVLDTFAMHFGVPGFSPRHDLIRQKEREGTEVFAAIEDDEACDHFRDKVNLLVEELLFVSKLLNADTYTPDQFRLKLDQIHGDCIVLDNALSQQLEEQSQGQ